MSPPYAPPATPPAFEFMTEAEKGLIENRVLMLTNQVAALRGDSDRRAIVQGEILDKLVAGQQQLLEGQREAARVRGVFAQTATFFLEKLGVL